MMKGYRIFEQGGIRVFFPFVKQQNKNQWG
jgi:hypothetical protein